MSGSLLTDPRGLDPINLEQFFGSRLSFLNPTVSTQNSGKKSQKISHVTTSKPSTKKWQGMSDDDKKKYIEKLVNIFVDFIEAFKENEKNKIIKNRDDMLQIWKNYETEIIPHKEVNKGDLKKYLELDIQNVKKILQALDKQQTLIRNEKQRNKKSLKQRIKKVFMLPSKKREIENKEKKWNNARMNLVGKITNILNELGQLQKK